MQRESQLVPPPDGTFTVEVQPQEKQPSLARTTQEIDLGVSSPEEVDQMLKTSILDALQAGDWGQGQQLMDVQRIFAVINKVSTSKIEPEPEKRTTAEMKAVQIGEVSRYIHDYLETHPHQRSSFMDMTDNAPGISPSMLIDMVDTQLHEQDSVDTNDLGYQHRNQTFLEAKLLVAGIPDSEDRLACIYVWNKNGVPKFPKPERPQKIMLISNIDQLREETLAEAAQKMTTQLKEVGTIAENGTDAHSNLSPTQMRQLSFYLNAIFPGTDPISREQLSQNLELYNVTTKSLLAEENCPDELKTLLGRATTD